MTFNLMKLNIDIQKKEGTDMKKTLALTAVLSIVLILVLTGCSNSSDVQGRDLTAKLAVEYTVPDGAEIVEDLTYACIDYAYSRDIVKVSENSDVIVRGTVEKVTNTAVFNADNGEEYGIPYAAINFRVSESLKGDLKKEDKITIFQTGSYMPLRDYIKNYCACSEREIKEILNGMSDDRIDKAFYHISPIDEAPAGVGEECIYFLMREGDDSSTPGSYRLTRGAASVLHCKLDGTLTRYPSDSAPVDPKEKIDYEVFTLDAVKTAIAKAWSGN